MKPYKIVSFALEHDDYDRLKEHARQAGESASAIIRQEILKVVGSPNTGTPATGIKIISQRRADRKADALIWIYPPQQV